MLPNRQLSWIRIPSSSAGRWGKLLSSDPIWCCCRQYLWWLPGCGGSLPPFLPSRALCVRKVVLQWRVCLCFSSRPFAHPSLRFLPPRFWRLWGMAAALITIPSCKRNVELELGWPNKQTKAVEENFLEGYTQATEADFLGFRHSWTGG